MRRARWTRHHWLSRKVTVAPLPGGHGSATVVPCQCRWWSRLRFLLTLR